uniref:Uncharacterized protein n=1 Tax=Anguilla anguilla TaxID=7936 RepID=A0A0E9PI77_ANGAN
MLRKVALKNTKLATTSVVFLLNLFENLS